jgi:hypothetical protein
LAIVEQQLGNTDTGIQELLRKQALGIRSNKVSRATVDKRQLGKAKASAGGEDDEGRPPVLGVGHAELLIQNDPDGARRIFKPTLPVIPSSDSTATQDGKEVSHCGLLIKGSLDQC